MAAAISGSSGDSSSLLVSSESSVQSTSRSMSEAPFPVQRSLLVASALEERVLCNYHLSEPATCRFWRRSINDLYLVRAGETRFVLRICPAYWRSYDHLSAEIELLNFLRSARISVPQPVRQKGGIYIQTLNAPEGSRFAALFTFVPGATYIGSEVQSHCYGQAIACLHAATDSYPAGRAGFSFEPTDMVDESLDRLRPLCADHQDDLHYLLEISNGLRQASSNLPRRAPQYGICHGDVNDGNILFGDHGQWALLDFEYFGYGWRVFDIGTFVDNQLYHLGNTAEAQAIWAAFLEGYQSVRSLSQTELEVLPSFVMLRQIWLLGRGAKFSPNIGLNLFEDWVFNRCMPLIRQWMVEPWRPQ